MTSDSEVLAIELSIGDNLINEMREHGFDTEVTRKGFDGADVVTILVAFVSASILPIASIVKKAIESKKHISVKYKGVEIKGVSEKKLNELLAAIHQKKD